MFTFTALFLIKKAYSATTLRDIRTQFQGKPNFPESDEELFDILAVLESWIPQSVVAAKGKPYLTYLCKKYFTAAPEFTIGTTVKDEDDIAATLTKYVEKYPTGPESNLKNFTLSIDAAKKAVTEESDVDDKAEHFADDDYAVINAGADVIGEANGWKLYRCDKKAKGDAAIKAMGRLCNNKKTGVTWCTGEDRGPVTAYINNGPFYVAVQNGRTRYALAHQQGPHVIDIIPPENVVVWHTGDANTKGQFPKLEEVSAKINKPFDFSTISSIPSELIPVLTEAEKVDQHLAQMVPIPAPFDKESLKAIIRATPPADMVADWNANTRNSGRVQAVMGVSIDLRQDLKDVYEQFSTETLNNYITALAAAKYTRLPQSLEDFIVEQF